MRVPSLTTILYIILPLAILGSFIFAYIQQYFILNLTYFAFIAGILIVWAALGARQETRKISWQQAIKNLEPVTAKFKASHGVTPKVDFMTVRSDMRRYSDSCKVWDAQMDTANGKVAILQDRRSGEIVALDFTVGSRTSPVAQGRWETNMPPQYVPPKTETLLKTKTTPQ